MENLLPHTVSETLDRVCAILEETAQIQRENKQLQRETAQLQRENAQLQRENAENSRIESEKSRIESKKSRVDAEKRMKNLEKLMGSWANNQGFFAEEYFFNSFEQKKRNFFGEKFNRLIHNVRGIKEGAEDEYDILLINGKSVGIIETKFKAHLNDLPNVLRKAETFRINFPEYNTHKIYLGLATMAFYKRLEEECIKKGIAIIKQVGDTVVINDVHLKHF